MRDPEDQNEPRENSSSHGAQEPTASQAIVPAPRRAVARVEFIRALATQTGAVRELANQHLSRKRQPLARNRMLRKLLGTSHPFFVLPMHFSSETLMLFAGKQRVAEASSWAAQWKLAVPWLRAWATFALVLWDVASSCRDPDCPFECGKIRDDSGFALEQALSLPAMLMVGEPPLAISILQTMEADEARGDALYADAPTDQDDIQSKYFPLHMRRVSEPLPGPHPLFETKKQFLQRAEVAWDRTIEGLAKQGVSLKVPRKLREHSEWLVRYQVLGETAASIVERLDNTDSSTVYKAVKALGHTIELPIRSLAENLENLK